mmetsp:Transcript_23437/g.29532  ORF Transcript_23437/g.29532 Transcript_23437/m.29532 type:complete len:212 (-) Transcript_23437:66-701(-)
MPPQQQDSQHLTETIGNQRVIARANDKNQIKIGCCAVKEIGLENFIRRIVLENDLRLTNDVVFNLNERGILYSWKEVFEVERVYSQCLGISDRLYNCRSYTLEPQQQLVYFLLEEYNKRIWSFLPEFKFYVVVFCHFDSERAVTKVEVQYDQMSFFLHCLGIIKMHRWVSANILTPIALRWMKVYKATGTVHPITFLANIGLAIWLLSKLF